MSRPKVRAPEEVDEDIVRVLDKDGELVDGAEAPDLSDEELVEMYWHMVMGRYADKRAEVLHKQGHGLYPTIAGQEALVGSAYGLADEDWMFPAYREWVGTLVHDYPLENFIEYWAGYEEGHDLPDDLNVFPFSVSIAVHVMHAVGAAWASKIKGEDDTAYVTYFSDGATSQGDLHEAMNFAGVFDTPNVFICANNQYAISVPFSKQSASATIAQRGTSYDMPGVLVDGMDPLAVYKATKEAVDRAKSPPDDGLNRSTLIELLQFRYGSHSVIDDDTAYRTEEEFRLVEEWKKRDPLDRLEAYLRSEGLLDDEYKDQIWDEVAEEWDTTFEEVHAREKPDPENIFSHVFDEMPWNLQEQQEWLEELRAEYGDEKLLEASARSWEDDFMQGE